VTRVAAGAAGLVLDAGAWSTAVDPVPEFATAERVPLAAPA
jgi:hypothetical protein